MNRLFWKIFVSFWLTLIVFAGAVMFAASNYLEATRTHEEHGRPLERLPVYHRQAQLADDRGGIEGLQEWAEELDRREAIPMLLIDEQGRDLLGRTVSPFVIARLNRERMRALHDEHDEHERRERRSGRGVRQDGGTAGKGVRRPEAIAA